MNPGLFFLIAVVAIVVIFFILRERENRRDEEWRGKARSDNGQPDITATREWVEQHVQKQMISCQFKIDSLKSELEQRTRKQHTQKIESEKAEKEAYESIRAELGLIQVTGFNDWETVEQVNEGDHYYEIKHDYFYWTQDGKYYRVHKGTRTYATDETIHLYSQVSEETTKERYEAAWKSFDAWWQSNGSWGIKYESIVPDPNSTVDRSQFNGAYAAN